MKGLRGRSLAGTSTDGPVPLPPVAFARRRGAVIPGFRDLPASETQAGLKTERLRILLAVRPTVPELPEFFAETAAPEVASKTRETSMPSQRADVLQNASFLTTSPDIFMPSPHSATFNAHNTISLADNLPIFPHALLQLADLSDPVGQCVESAQVFAHSGIWLG